MTQSLKHCCKEIDLYINDSTNPLYYNPIFREHHIKAYQKYKVLIIECCPWCGTQLPKELRDEFFDILENEYNIETNIGDYKTNPSIPAEFRTDEWWKKRGL